MGTKTAFRLFTLSLLPIISAGYLAFCWTVRHHTILVTGYGLINDSAENLSVIKSAVSSINILVITLALWPVKTLLVDIKGEEFFRSLRQSDIGHGHTQKKIDLATANSLSSPSLGMLTTITIIVRRKCSPHFVMAFICGFVVIAVSVLVPGTLSVGEILVDSKVMSMNVGAMPVESVGLCDSAIDCFGYTDNVNNLVEEAASIAWAEVALNISYSFSAHSQGFEFMDSPQYIIPLPVDLSPTTSTRWLTDVFVLRPSCNWQATNLTGGTFALDNTAPNSRVPVSMVDLGLEINLCFTGDECLVTQFYMDYASLSYEYAGHRRLLSGQSIWVLSQYGRPSFDVTFDTTGIPIFKITDGFGTFVIAILVCSPNPSIETVQVQSRGRDLTILPSNTGTLGNSIHGQDAKRGNLDQREGDMFFTALFMRLRDAGPPVPLLGFRTFRSGSQLQASLIFGWDQVHPFVSSESTPMTVWTPMPISNITAMYSRLLQSAAKPYLAGALGTAQVPGVTSTPALVFTAPLAYVIMSTVLLATLNIVHTLAFFRSGRGEVFNLFTIASVLQDSNVQIEVTKFREQSQELKAEELQSAFEAESRHRVLELRRLKEEKEDRVLVVGGYDVL